MQGAVFDVPNELKDLIEVRTYLGGTPLSVMHRHNVVVYACTVMRTLSLCVCVRAWRGGGGGVVKNARCYRLQAGNPQSSHRLGTIGHFTPLLRRSCSST